MKNNKTKELALYSLFIAMVFLLTRIIQIPIAVTNGYIHLGDSCILLISIFFGKKYGSICAGLGSMLADLLSPYAHWAIFTLIIKFMMGYVAGSLSNYNKGKANLFSINTFVSSLIAVLVMVFGYFIGGAILEGVGASIASIFPNIIQGVMGFLIFLIIGSTFDKINIRKYANNK